MMNAYTSYTEAHPTLSIEELVKARKSLGEPPQEIEIQLSEHTIINDDLGPYITRIDYPNALGGLIIPGRRRKSVLVMHPQTFMDYAHLFPVGIVVTGIDSINRWKKKKAVERIMAAWPTIPARYVYAVVTAVMVLVMALVS